MPRNGERVSKHFLRRTARVAAARWNARYPDSHYRARDVSYVRGPFGFKVVLERKKSPRPVD